MYDMVCIYCGGSTSVVNSRHQKKQNAVWRRRQCDSCKAVFTTEETADYEKSWTVASMSGTLSPFLRDKLLLSIYKSCQHRDTAMSDTIGLTDTAVSQLRSHVVDGALEAATIAAVVLAILENFDEAAATHYRAFHKANL
jgi:transcriptional regulator NrdR family protein